MRDRHGCAKVFCSREEEAYHAGRAAGHGEARVNAVFAFGSGLVVTVAAFLLLLWSYWPTLERGLK